MTFFKEASQWKSMQMYRLNFQDQEQKNYWREDMILSLMLSVMVFLHLFHLLKGHCWKMWTGIHSLILLVPLGSLMWDIFIKRWQKLYMIKLINIIILVLIYFIMLYLLHLLYKFDQYTWVDMLINTFY